MNSYLIHYQGRQGLCIAVESGRDAFHAVANFLALRKLRQIVSMRRMINGHHSGPVYL